MTSKATRLLVGGLTALSMLLLPGVAMAQPTPVTPLEPADDLVVLDLYNLTDVHGHISQVAHYKSGDIIEAGLPAVGCYLNQARLNNPNSSFTLLGDNVGASPYQTGILHDNPTVAALNKLMPLASTIGNHELDLGQEVFKARVDGTTVKVNDEDVTFEKLAFPYLGANVEGLGEYLGDYVVWESPSGVKVAFIGAIAEDVPYKLSPGITDGMTFNDPIPVLNNTAKKLKDSGEADVVIAMLDDDVKNNYPKMGANIDGLMGGDTHVPYNFDMVEGAEGNKLSATASGSYTDNLSNIKVTFNKSTGKVVSSKVEMIPAAELAKCTDDPYGIQPIVDKALADSEVAGEKVIATGITDSFFRAVFETSEGPQGPGSNRGHESSLGDLVADAMRDTIFTTEGKLVDIGIVNAGGLRTDLVPSAEGNITYKQTYEVMPFGNETGYVTLSGDQFKTLLEQQWKTDLNSQNSRPMLKLGISDNVSYTYDSTRPYGNRITSIVINGKPYNPKANYTIGSVTFLLAGGDSFPVLTENGPYVNNGDLDRDLFNKYLAANSGVKPRMTKSSVGVTLPEGPVPEGEDLVIALRGLAFTEGPAHNVSGVSLEFLGITQSPAESPDLSLVDDNASSEENAVITTDGAGRLVISQSTDFLCKSHPGELIESPILISNRIGEAVYFVVNEQHNLKVSVQCKPAVKDPATGGEADPPKTSATGDKNTKPGLSKTGAHSWQLGLVALLLAAAGGLALSMRRREN